MYPVKAIAKSEMSKALREGIDGMVEILPEPKIAQLFW